MGPLNRVLREWEAFYNVKRPHQSLGWLSPMEYLAGRRLKDASLTLAVSYAPNERRALTERGAGGYTMRLGLFARRWRVAGTCLSGLGNRRSGAGSGGTGSWRACIRPAGGAC